MPSRVPGISWMSPLDFFLKTNSEATELKEKRVTIEFKWLLRFAIKIMVTRTCEKKMCQRKRLSPLILLFSGWILPQKNLRQSEPPWEGPMGQGSCCGNLETLFFRQAGDVCHGGLHQKRTQHWTYATIAKTKTWCVCVCVHMIG